MLLTYLYIDKIYILKFIAIALITVGKEPLHNVNTPSSLIILDNASKTFL